MSAEPRVRYRFASFCLDPEQRSLLRDDAPVAITPKVFDLLLALVERAGRLVTKQELLERVWPDTFVEEANLSVHVSVLRRTLGDETIETVPKRGYRFVAPVVRDDSSIEGTPGPRENDTSPTVTVARRKHRALYMVAVVVMAVAVGAVGLRSARPYAVAIAPFENPTAHRMAGPLVDGLARTVASRLSGVSPRLMVKTAARSKESISTAQDAVALGRSLGVDAVLIGRIFQNSRNIDWTFEAELVGVSDGSLLWTGDYQATLTSVYAVQDHVAMEVARHVPVELSADELKALERHGSKNPKAQQLVDRVDSLTYQVTPASLRKAIDYAQQAIALDPTYGIPYGQIANAYSLLGHIDAIRPAEAEREARSWRERAQAVDSEIYTSHITELSGDSRGWDWSGLQEAGGLHPFYQDYLVAAGRVNELIASERQDVLDHPTYVDDYWRGLHAYFGRHYDLSIQLYREALELNPGFTAAHLGSSRAHAQMRDYAAAVREARAASELPRSSGILGYALGAGGHPREARALLDELTVRSRTEYVTPLNFAWISLGLGAKDDALKWLRQACDAKVEETAYVKVDPIYDAIRTNPAFSELVKCVGLEREAQD